MDIYHDKPIDRTAALVTSRGESYAPPLKNCHVTESPLPMPIRTFRGTAKNLSGFEFGRFTVVGMSKEVNKRWVCRCVCGTYALRTSKAIKNPNNDIDSCRECRHRAYVNRREDHKARGLF